MPHYGSNNSRTSYGQVTDAKVGLDAKGSLQISDERILAFRRYATAVRVYQMASTSSTRMCCPVMFRPSDYYAWKWGPISTIPVDSDMSGIRSCTTGPDAPSAFDRARLRRRAMDRDRRSNSPYGRLLTTLTASGQGRNQNFYDKKFRSRGSRRRATLFLGLRMTSRLEDDPSDKSRSLHSSVISQGWYCGCHPKSA